MVPPPAVSRQSLGQLVNIPALLHLAKVMRHPSYLVPHDVSALDKIDIAKLKRRGIKYIVFDKDNTICKPYESEVYDKFKEKVEEFKCCFPNSVAFLSNSAGSSDDMDFCEALQVERATGIPVIRHALKKPGCVADVLGFFSAENRDRVIGGASSETSGHRAEGAAVDGHRAEVLPREICVIGDRLLTDVVFANANGMVSIFVPQITNENDNRLAVCIRVVERKVLLPIFSWLCGNKEL